ncbi:ribonuclease R [Patescibacteria group bacterium]
MNKKDSTKRRDFHKNKKTPKKTILEGPLRLTAKGVGYVDVEEFESGIEIDPGSLNTGMHMDRVSVVLHPKIKEFRGIKKRTGEVVEVLFRHKMKFVGVLKKKNGAWFLQPDDQKMYTDIVIPDCFAKDAVENNKALVKIESWDDPKMPPVGEILSILGSEGNNDVEMKSIVLEKGLSIEFPKEVEKEAKNISREISKEEIEKRRDMRDTITFTIDPADAKDFDDALSFETKENGDIEIGIHIADVAHFVRPGTALDKEARERATSIYLVDRTIPMLPETISNDLCSLNPHEDKLAFSAVFTFSKKDLDANKINIVDEWFGRTIIHSNHRFTYESAQENIDTHNGAYNEELHTCNNIAKMLQMERFERGAIAFERDEVRFKLDVNGKPLGVEVKKRQDTNKMIEDFMLLANKKVAEFIDKKDKNITNTFVYRVHDVPNADKVRELAAFLKSIGHKLEIGETGPKSKDINTMLNAIRGSAEEELIQTATLRAMAKAIYTTKNIGHFGLSFTHYTHFTSPIRRYPDVMVHRLIATYLAGDKLKKGAAEEFEAASRYSSEREKSATQAERDSIKYKQVEYMQGNVGKTYDGKITGVTKWGVYVEEVSSRAEGLVHIKNMADDFYILDEKNYRLVGEKTKKQYRIGDKLKIKLIGADLEKRALDWEFPEA